MFSVNAGRSVYMPYRLLWNRKGVKQMERGDYSYYNLMSLAVPLKNWIKNFLEKRKWFDFWGFVQLSDSESVWHLYEVGMEGLFHDQDWLSGTRRWRFRVCIAQVCLAPLAPLESSRHSTPGAGQWTGPRAVPLGPECGPGTLAGLMQTEGAWEMPPLQGLSGICVISGEISQGHSLFSKRQLLIHC